jgi:hypothetical protein
MWGAATPVAAFGCANRWSDSPIPLPAAHSRCCLPETRWFQHECAVSQRDSADFRPIGGVSSILEAKIPEKR